MKTIYKYPLEITGEQDIFLPEGARILSVKWVKEQIVLYALVEPAAQQVKHKIAIVGTGAPFCIEEPYTFIGSVVLYSGDLVFHIFEIL